LSAPDGFMSIRMGMPRVSRERFAGSGFSVSLPPGTFSQPITPQSDPSQMAMRIFAVPSSTSQSPDGSPAMAGVPVRARSIASTDIRFMLTTSTTDAAIQLPLKRRNSIIAA
jgi:hypothetical protein